MTTVEDCIHHWMLPTPDGRAVLPALCKKCGAVRDYLAAEPDMGWKDLNNQSIGAPKDSFRAAATYVKATARKTQLD